uniref:Uncharacterized protein n=1 Tax=Sphaerodactylus townsendi TaxID=933632 RepID=A0ACB8FM43_9SAUR
MIRHTHLGEKIYPGRHMWIQLKQRRNAGSPNVTPKVFGDIEGSGKECRERPKIAMSKKDNATPGTTGVGDTGYPHMDGSHFVTARSPERQPRTWSTQNDPPGKKHLPNSYPATKRHLDRDAVPTSRSTEMQPATTVMPSKSTVNISSHATKPRVKCTRQCKTRTLGINLRFRCAETRREAGPVASGYRAVVGQM